ncbi:cell adhesion molecule Dscam1-like isoform X2 [Ornithodoros turicata]|uniref:cell adhesion molecule Dscam1-like isoform X2 n=1 Tax=Ornithodoros turicata TaxID=34597 RepID=UPI0031399099
MSALMSSAADVLLRVIARNTGYNNVEKWEVQRYREGGRYSVFPSGELHVRHVTQADGMGDYRCRTRHRLTGETKLSSFGRLVVTDLKVNVLPRISNIHTTVTAQELDTVQMPCAAQGYPAPKYTWQRLSRDDGTPVHVGNNGRVEPLDGSLIIRKITSEDSGRYLCTVSNGVGEETAHITLQVHAPLEVKLIPDVLTAHVGSSATLNCSVTGRPVINVHWLKDGRPLMGDHMRVLFLEQHRVVLIKNVEASDAGMYQCFVSNADDEAQGQTQVVLGDSAPVLLESFREHTHQVGDHLQLKCEATGSPEPRISWSVDDIPVTRASSNRIVINEATRGEGHLSSSITVSRMKLEDGGLWQCEAVNTAGRAASAARVNVQGPLAVRPFPSNRTAVAMDTLQLHCRVLGYPIEAVLWEKDGRKLPFHHRQRVFPNGTLHILTTAVSDAGEYTCIAKNAQGQSARAKLSLSVKVPPLIERFAFDEHLYEGMRTRIYCNIARGDPPVSIAWFRDGHPVRGSADLQVRVLDAFSVALVIESLSPRHNGNYTCVASNPAATVNYTAELRVHVPPHWLKEPVDTSAVEGRSVNMDCMADGHPAPRVTWQRGLEPSSTEYRQILSGPDYQVFENGTLRISQVQRSDQGSYLCQAANGVGTGLSTVIQLKVNVPARFVESYRNETVRRGRSINLRCRALGDAPMKIRWTRSGRELQAHKSLKIKEEVTEDGMTSVMSISSAEREHSGIFTCEVTNSFGHDETQLRLLVQEPPEVPSDFNVTSVGSRSVSLLWNEPYHGNSPITSYLLQFKNASESWQSRGVQNVTVTRDQTSWSVRGLLPSCHYHFRAAALNVIGQGPYTSPALNVITDEEVPGSPPTRVYVQTLGPQSLKVTWHPPVRELRHGTIKGYYVGYKLYNSSDLHLYKTIEARGDDFEAPAECVLNNLKTFTKYSILVQAYNSIGAGPRSDEIIVQTAEDVPHVAPTDVSCSPTSPSSLKVTWKEVPGSHLNGAHKGYKAVLREVAPEAEEREKEVGSSATAAVMDRLGPYTNYSVQVAAVTGAGTGRFSSPRYCRTPEAVPEAPEDIKALVLAPDAILVSWKPPRLPNGIVQKYTVYSRSHGYGKQAAATRHVPVPSSQFWHETRGLRTGLRYDFWVTASTSAGEGPATRIVTQSPDIRAPARIASFSKEMRVPSKQDLELPCRAAGQPTPAREWRRRDRPVSDSERIKLLPSGTLRIDSIEQDDSGNYSCVVHNLYGRDAILYSVFIAAPLRPSSLVVLSTSFKSITLSWQSKIALDGSSAPFVKEYELHYKRQQGEWDMVRFSPEKGNGTQVHELGALFCGSQYHLYLVAVGDRGRSDPSDTVFARTRGGIPLAPKQETFLWANATSLTMRPGTWNEGGCPITHLSVEYRARGPGPGPWLVASRALTPREGPMTLHDLRPDTWYSVRVTAFSEAGPTVAEYTVRTQSMPPAPHATFLPELMVHSSGGAEDLSFVVPLATSLAVAAAASALVLLYVCCRHRSRGAALFKSPGCQSGRVEACAETALMKRGSQDVLSTASGRQISYLASPSRRSVAPTGSPTHTRHSIGSIEDISHYTSFGDNQSRSNNARVMLKKSQDSQSTNTRSKKPASSQKLTNAEDMQRKEKSTSVHTPGAQSNHYDNPRAAKNTGCLKSWTPADKGSRPFVIPQETKSALEMEQEGGSPQWSRARRDSGKFINSNAAIIEKTYFFHEDDLHGDEVEGYCVSLSPRLGMKYS